jgi:hypothetical protein
MVTETGEMEREVPIRWSAPSAVTLHGGCLVGDWSKTTRQVSPGKHLLSGFVKLAESAKDVEFGTYAHRWGMLGLCKKHMVPMTARNHDRGDINCIDAVAEPISKWREHARMAWAIVIAASQLHQGVRVDAKVRQVLPDVSDFPTPSGKAGSPADNERASVEVAVNRWIGNAALRPRLVWRGERPTFEFGSYGGTRLFAAIGLELLLAVAQQDSFFNCAACGGVFARGPRKPKSNQNNYCESCRKTGAANKHSSAVRYGKLRAQERRENKAGHES